MVEVATANCFLFVKNSTHFAIECPASKPIFTDLFFPFSIEEQNLKICKLWFFGFYQQLITILGSFQYVISHPRSQGVNARSSRI